MSVLIDIYLKNHMIRQRQAFWPCYPEVQRKVVYIDVLPERLPRTGEYPFILYYSEEFLACCMQLSSFSEVWEKIEMICIGKGWEQAIASGRGGIEVSGYGGADEQIEELFNRKLAAYKRYQYPERKESFGLLYRELTFYVIRICRITSSLGSLMLWIIHQLELRFDFSGYRGSGGR